MQEVLQHESSEPWLIHHPLSAGDAVVMRTVRAAIEPHKGELQGVAARGPFDAIMERVPAPEGVTYEEDRVGGISGWWCRPKNAREGQAVLHIHGGAFQWGSAKAFRHLAGHIARGAGAETFVPDYRLAPENPFPAAVEDVRACYFGLVERGFSRIVTTGDSAGGNLMLGLLAYLKINKPAGSEAVVGAVALSPVTDLTSSGESWSTRAAADPIFTLSQGTEFVRSYLGTHSPEDPLASPLLADLRGFPPLRVHVGNDEVLLSDSVRLVERAVAESVDARLDIWEGMIHVFQGSLGSLEASEKSLQLVGDFLVTCLVSVGSKG